MKILLIRLRLIGDVVFTTPLIGALKRTYPNAHLSYLVERDAAPVVAGNPHVDDLIVIGKSRGWRRVRDDARLAMRLRRERFDLVLDLHGGPRSALLTFATGAPAGSATISRAAGGSTRIACTDRPACIRDTRW